MRNMLDLDSSLLDRLCQREGVLDGCISASSDFFDMFKGSHRFITPSYSYGNQQSASILLPSTLERRRVRAASPELRRIRFRGTKHKKAGLTKQRNSGTGFNMGVYLLSSPLLHERIN
ncbi:hypothetical protein V8C42DRAFT_243861 [Trichoderma barbatum]